MVPVGPVAGWKAGMRRQRQVDRKMEDAGGGPRLAVQRSGAGGSHQAGGRTLHYTIGVR